MKALPMIPKILSRIGLLFLPVFFCLLILQPDARGYYDKKRLYTDAYSATELEMVVEEYQTKVNVLNSQIRDIQKDLDWLILKINRISDAGRKVPHTLKTSVGKKEERLALLLKERKRLEVVVSEYERALEEKSRQMAAKAPEAQIKSSPIQPAAPVIKEPDQSTVQAKISDLERAVKKAGLEDWVEVLDADGGCAKINNTLPILFSSGSAVLAKEYKPFLKKLAHFLKSYDVKIYVNGFADPDPIRTKRYPSNFELGASRAANIVHEMVRYGLKPDVFKIGTTGEYRFAAKTPTKKKSFQRRAQVIVVFNS